jgi:hypothetical protein
MNMTMKMMVKLFLHAARFVQSSMNMNLILELFIDAMSTDCSNS